MKTFKEYITENHPESIEEGAFRNAATYALMGLGALGVAGKMPKVVTSAANTVKSAVTSRFQDQDHDEEEDNITTKMNRYDQKLKIAAQRAGVPKSEWGRLKGHATGGVITVVNGRKVPLTPREQIDVKDSIEFGRSMGNRMGD